MTTSNEHNNAPAVPQGLPAFDDLDDDVIDAACTAGSLLYRVDLMRAYECIRKALAATPTPAPAQEVDKSQLEKMRERGATAWAGVDAQSLRAGGEPAQEVVIPQGYEIHELPPDYSGPVWIESQVRYLARQTACASQPTTDTEVGAQEVGLTDEQKTWAVNQLMGQAQVFASVWSLVGGRFDFGNAREEAEKAKTELRSMVVDALRAKGGKHV